MGNGLRPIHPALATADTELLGRPTCRRFVSGLWEIAGGQLVVTPTVADELPGNARMSEGRYWEKECAVWARDGLEELEDPGEMVRAVRQALPARTRAAEDTRLRETRSAAAEAGFRGFSP